MTTRATNIEVNEAIDWLQGLLAAVWSGNDGQPVDPEVSLRDAGVDSGAIVAFLARAQSEFDVVWSEDLPPGSLESIAKVARTIVRACGR